MLSGANVKSTVTKNSADAGFPHLRMGNELNRHYIQLRKRPKTRLGHD